MSTLIIGTRCDDRVVLTADRRELRGYEHSFLSFDAILKLKNVIDPWPHQKPEAKWVDRADVLYFSNTMNPRGAGQGKNANTLGGSRNESNII